jgi:23S rRNA (guanine745-N1)-methyltransferase
MLCTVRDCHLPLVREDRRAVCARGHSFDVARSGYINLLQPQDRKSKQPGDTPEAVIARRRLHDRGITAPLLQAIAEMAAPSSEDSVLDVGCGDGFYLGSLAAQGGFEAHGVDISIPAVDADRFVPWADQSFSLILSITARMNSPEFRRAIREDGRLLVALPAPDDICELRGAGRDRVERTVEHFGGEFTLIGRSRATTAAELDAEAVHDVLHSIYRPLRAQPLTAMRVTFSLDLLLFRITNR